MRSKETRWRRWGGCLWRVDREGTLDVRPSPDGDGLLGAWDGAAPWCGGEGTPGTPVRAGAPIRRAVVADGVRAATLEGMFRGCGSLREVDLTGLDASCAVSASSMFEGCIQLVRADLTGLRLDSLRDASSMFAGCWSMGEVRLAPLGAGTLEDASRMFDQCWLLRTVDLTGTDFGGAVRLNAMYRDCRSLGHLVLGGGDFGRVVSADEMFLDCRDLAAVDLEGVDALSLETAVGIFSGCNRLREVDLSTVRMPNVRAIDRAFDGCVTLRRVRPPVAPMASVESAERLFSGCPTLAGVDLRPLGGCNLHSGAHMFDRCGRLARALLPDDLGVDTPYVVRQLGALGAELVVEHEYEVTCSESAVYTLDLVAGDEDEAVSAAHDILLGVGDRDGALVLDPPQGVRISAACARRDWEVTEHQAVAGGARYTVECMEDMSYGLAVSSADEDGALREAHDVLLGDGATPGALRVCPPSGTVISCQVTARDWTVARRRQRAARASLRP